MVVATFWATFVMLSLLGIEVTSGQGDTVVNILFIYQDEEWRKLFDETVAKYFSHHDQRNLKIRVGRVHAFDAKKSSDFDTLATEFCKFYEEAMGSDAKPEVAIDFTRIGTPSEAVKMVLRAMQMPTIAGSFGQEGDIKEWRDLKDDQHKFLIQISPPADVLIQAVRSLVEKQDMTSAVVLFDEEQYEMYHKYKALLQNLPTRHLLTKTETKVGELRKQIDHLVHVDIVNYFIAGKVSQITQVLTEASRENVEDGPYFSDEFAWYSMTLVPGEEEVPQCGECEVDVTLIHVVPYAVLEMTNPRKRFLNQTLGPTQNDPLSLSHMFYFDIAVDAVLAIGRLKQQGKYKVSGVKQTCGYDPLTKKVKGYSGVTLDLLKELRSVAVAGQNMVKLRLDREGKPGKNYAEVKANIYRLVYEAKQAKPRTKDRIGYWTADFGSTESRQLRIQNETQLAAHRAYTVFRIVTVVQAPFVMEFENCSTKGKGNKYKNCFYGYCIDLLHKITEDLKFNYTIRAVEGYGYMNDSAPHNWDGMVLQLEKRKADIALGAMSVMAERESVVDFTVPYYDLVGISILMKKPRVPTSLFKFLTVLENEVWGCILGAYFFTSFLMWIFDRWSPYSYQNNREKYEDDEEKREFNLKECLWFCMTSLTPQGGGEAPKNLSGRLVAATWWLFGFIIIASYTANLAAFLTVSRLDAPIESLDDLSKQYKIQYAPMRGSGAWIYFNRMKNIEARFHDIWRNMTLNESLSALERAEISVWEYPVSDKYTRMLAAMEENDPPWNFTSAMEKVRAVNNDSSKDRDGFAFLDEATNVRWQTTISCDFDQKGEEFSRKPYAIAVQKGSPLKESISHMILKLLNQRTLEQLKENWWSNATYKVVCPKEDNQSDGISIHNIGGVFIVIFVGIVMACFTLIFEYWWNRKKNRTEELGDPPSSNQFTSTVPPSPPEMERANFNTQYDKPPERIVLPSVENCW